MISQAEGLAKNFNLNYNFIKTKIIFPWTKLKPGILPIFSWIFLNEINITPKPDIIISCGRKSVYLSVYFKKKYKNIINIHIQDPKINFKNFNYIVAPKHDNISGYNVINSIGAIHKFDKNEFTNLLDKEYQIPKKNLVSIIIGGSNNHYKFSTKEFHKLILKIKEIINFNSKKNFLILTSRRSTKEMINLLKNELKNLAIIYNEKEKNPYTFALKNSEFFIVTSDSTSMISECAFTGKPLYVFHLPYKRKSRRIENFHNQFNSLNITKELNNKNELVHWNYEILNESKRISSIIKKRIIKENS